MKKLFSLLFLAASACPLLACSTFLLNKNGQLVFGRNYDWVSGNGILLVNAAGLQKKSFLPTAAEGLSWTSKYGSVTFNQFGKEMPHGGMNEKGLVVELMWLQGTAYPAADKRAALNELQWIQYQLDNCASIEEVLATDKTVRIDRDNAAPLHYLIADASGNAATIEFLNGETIVHTGKELPAPVLTNSTYESSVAQLNPETRSANTNNSLTRFTNACSMLQQYQEGNIATAPVDYAFNMLDKISQAQYTKWSIVYDITNRQVHFITNDYNERKSVSFSDLDFTCGGQAKSIDINNAFKGNIAGNLSPLTAGQNMLVVRRSVNESKTHLQITEESILLLGKYFSTIKCR